MPKRPTGRRTTKTSAPTTGAPRKAATSSGATRAQIVWISFMGAMTAVGGLLLLVDGRKPTPRADGLSLSPLAAATTLGSSHSSDPITQTRAPLNTEQWQAIVIHHSGFAIGSPTSIAKEHDAIGDSANVVSGLTGAGQTGSGQSGSGQAGSGQAGSGQAGPGLGHHFVIGNGAGMDDGQVHIGYRWLDQKHGAAFTDAQNQWLNQHAVSICIVGDGNRAAFTPAQLLQLQNLVGSLRRQLSIPGDRVYLRSDVSPGASDPGKHFPEQVVNTLRQ